MVIVCYETLAATGKGKVGGGKFFLRKLLKIVNFRRFCTWTLSPEGERE
jgi:hypothetical protein